MQLQAASHIGIGIERPLEEVAGFLSAEPGTFTAWASGLGRVLSRRGDDMWLFETPTGEMAVRFTPRNPRGVPDHTLVPDAGPPMYNPTRVFANAAGSEVVATRVSRDLARLKTLLERRTDEVSGAP